MRRGCCVLETVRNDSNMLMLSRHTWLLVPDPIGELVMLLGP